MNSEPEATYQLVAKTFQGLESILASELTELGATDIEIGRRMVAFTGNKELMYRANFQLRTAIRVLKTIKRFRATTADEVYEKVKSIDWTQYLDLTTTFAVDSVVYSNEFRHSKFVAYKVKDAIVDQFREKTGERPNIRVTNPDLQLHIHVAEFDCTLSMDSSGESLHRRGYRQESVEAPLNEVLAAGIILQTGWNGQCDFIDPMCGSGTIAIEAALIARGIAPGVYRKGYAFEKWSDFDEELFNRIYEDESKEHPFCHHIYAYDINRNAVEIATRNVKAAGLGHEITVQQQDFKDFTQPQEKSIMITNPPYGERISAPDLLGLYKMIGERLKHQFVGNDAWILSYREECFDQIGLKPSLRTPLFNGSLECELRKYQIFDGRYDEMRASGGNIKSEDERRMMADHKRFKQHREFKNRLEEDSEDRRAKFKHHNPFAQKPSDKKMGDWRRNDGSERNEGHRERHRDDYRSFRSSQAAGPSASKAKGKGNRREGMSDSGANQFRKNSQNRGGHRNNYRDTGHDNRRGFWDNKGIMEYDYEED